jgi:Spy/CpxP family protein refolding chaperone
MNMTRIVVILGFLVSFAAGLVVGMETRHASIAAPPATHPARGRGWLASELALSSEQQEQLDKIWSETASRGGREQDDHRHKLREERDRAIAALVPPPDRPRYEAALKSYADQMAALDNQWRSHFQASVEKTKQILTPQQRAKYEELLSRRQWDRGGRDGGRDRDNRRGEDRAATRPASQP